MNSKIFILSVLLFTAVSLNSVFAAFGTNFNQCIQQNEGAGGNPAIANKWGYTGLYQMGVNYAAGAGLCKKPTKTMNLNQDWSQCDFDGPIAKQYGITNYADFTTGKNAAAVQNALMAVASANMWNTIVRNGLDKYVGQTVNGVLMTQDTMVAMAHLKGYGGLKKTLNGKVNADGNGTTTVAYASCLATCMTGSGGGKCSLKAGVSDDAQATSYADVCEDDGSGN